MITWKKEKENILKRLLLLTKQIYCFFQSYACKYMNYMLTNKENIYGETYHGPYPPTLKVLI